MSAASSAVPSVPSIAIDARKLADFGIGTYLRGLLAGLARLDTDSRYLLLAPGEAREVLPALPPNFTWVEESSAGYSLREQWSVGRTLARLAPDLFHAPHYVLPLSSPMPVVVTIHDLIHLLLPEFLPHPAAKLYARWMLRRAARRSERVLTVSEATARDLGVHLGIPRERICVTWNGVDDAFRRRLTPADLARELADLGLAPGYFLFLGNPKPHKNLPRTLQAFALLGRGEFGDGGDRGSLRDRLLVVAGAPESGEDRHRIERQRDELGLGDRLVILGRLASERLPGLVQGAEALLLPSLYEGFGLPVVEAMASSTPVVASTTPALVEVAGGAAELADPLDARAIAGAMARLATDPELRRRRVEAGLARAESFRWETTAAGTLAVYRAVLAAAAARRGSGAAE